MIGVQEERSTATPLAAPQGVSSQALPLDHLRGFCVS